MYQLQSFKIILILFKDKGIYSQPCPPMKKGKTVVKQKGKQKNFLDSNFHSFFVFTSF